MSPKPPSRPPQVQSLGSPQENPEESLNQLRELARQWHRRLQDPLLQRALAAGRASVSPLVRELLEMFPQE